MKLIEKIKSQYIKKEKKGVQKYLGRDDIKKAEKMNISLSQYMHALWNVDETRIIKLCDELIFPNIKDSHKVVEIGTGTGAFSEILLNKLPNLTYYSFEPNEDMKNYLTKYFSKYNFYSMESNGYQLNGLDDDSVDAIIAFGVFVYLEQQIAFNYFQEVSKKLKPGGYFIFNIHNFDNPYYEFMKHMENIFNYFGCRIMLSANYIIEYFKLLGLEYITILDKKEELDYFTYLVFRKKA